MDMYKSEEVIDIVKAKIYPTDNRIPKCNVVISAIKAPKA